MFSFRSLVWCVTVFVAVGLDTGILVRQTSALAAKFKPGVAAAPATKGAVY